MTLLQMILKHYDRAQKSAAKRGFADFCNHGRGAANPYAAAECRKHAAWQVGYELAQRSGC